MTAKLGLMSPNILNSKERADQCMTALNTLKSDEKVSYLICEVDYANK